MLATLERSEGGSQPAVRLRLWKRAGCSVSGPAGTSVPAHVATFVQRFLDLGSPMGQFRRPHHFAGCIIHER